MKIHERISYPLVNRSKDYFEKANNFIDLALLSQSISNEEYKEVKSLFWSRFWPGYISILLIGFSTIILQLFLGFATQITAYIIPKKFNYIFKIYKFITQKSLVYERNIAKAEYESGYKNKIEYNKYLEYLQKIYRDSIYPIYTGYSDDFKL